MPNNRVKCIRVSHSRWFKRTIAADPASGLTLPDLAQLADVFQLPFYRIASEAELDTVFDRAMWGSDQAASLGPAGMAKMIQHIRYIEPAMGDGVKRVYPSEVQIQKKLRRK